MHTPGSGRFSHLPDRLRERVSDLRADFRQWRSDVGEDPGLLLRTLPLRIALWVILGAALFFGLRGVVGGLMPRDAGSLEGATRAATLHVACADPACLAAYHTTRPMNFRDWPLVCEKCAKPSVERAGLCPRCKRWYAPSLGVNCSVCTRPASAPAAPPVASRPLSRDDAEDGWD